MTRLARVLALATLLSAVLFPAAARAQAPADSLSDLANWVRVGDRVTVTDASGRKVTGDIAGVKPDALSLALNEGIRSFTPPDIDTITRRRPDPVSNGALIGLGVGVGFFLVAATTSGGCGWGEDCGALYVVGTLFYAGIGAGIGAGVDALIPGRQVVIYRRPVGRATLGFSPRLAPARQAVVVSITF